jgi:hypothetical protein
MTRHRGLEILSDDAVTEALARTPIDQYLIWDGRACGAQEGSLRSRALGLVHEPWTPVSLRSLILKAARLDAGGGLDPATVRCAVRMHQSARPAVYLLVRRNALGEFVAVMDVPWPGSAARPIRAGDIVMDRAGRRLPALTLV